MSEHPPATKHYALITENWVDLDTPKPKQEIKPLPFDEIKKEEAND